MSTTRPCFCGDGHASQRPAERRLLGAEVLAPIAGPDAVLASKTKPQIDTLVASLDQFELGFQIQRQQPDVRV